MKKSKYTYERYKLLKKNNGNNTLNCNYDTRNENYQAGCRENADNFNLTRSPHNKVRDAQVDDWMRFDVSFDDLC